VERKEAAKDETHPKCAKLTPGYLIFSTIALSAGNSRPSGLYFARLGNAATNRPNRLARVLPIGDGDSTVSGDTPGASYYRKAAIRLMEFARAVQDPQIKLDLLDLASRFEGDFVHR